MFLAKIVGNTLAAAIIGGVACIVLLAIRYAIWPKHLPDNIARYRWLIAGAVGILLFATQILMKFDFSGSLAAIDAGVIYLIGECLKNDPSDVK